MFRVSLANAFAKRTLRPLLEKHQATPLSVTLDAGVTDPIYSGMVAKLNNDGTVGIADDTTTNPFGLFALDKNATINDTDGQASDGSSVGTATGYAFAVWQGGPDAYFRVDGTATEGAFDASRTDYAPGVDLYVASDGRLTSDTGSAKVGSVIEKVSDSRLVVRVSLPVA